MISVAKNYVYESGIIIFDIKDYGTSIFLKLSTKLIFLKSVKEDEGYLSSYDTYADMYARQYELGELKRSYIYLRLSGMSNAKFTFTDTGYNTLCCVDYSVNGGIYQSRLVYCDVNNLSWMIWIAQCLLQADIVAHYQRFKQFIKGTYYEKVMAESSTV